jgi:hypothetical protein
LEESNFVVLNTGSYRAVIEDISTEEQQFGPVLKWSCRILDLQEPEPVIITAMCSYKLTPKTKLYEWLCALGFSDLQMGQDINITSSLIGRQVGVYIAKEEKNGKFYSNIKSFMPLLGAGQAPAPQQVAPQVHQQGAPVHQGGPIYQAPQGQVPGGTYNPPPQPMAPPPQPMAPPSAPQQWAPPVQPTVAPAQPMMGQPAMGQPMMGGPQTGQAPTPGVSGDKQPFI